MSTEFAKVVLGAAKAVQAEADDTWRPPPAGGPAQSDMIVYNSLVSGSRTYIEKVAHQINGSYEHGWYDACGVMIRRLIETLIIEAFEHHKIEAQVKTASGDYVYLRDLITATLNCTSWSLGRNVKQALPRLKDVGDRSAHSRRFIAQRQDIDRLAPDLRDVIQELLTLANLK